MADDDLYGDSVYETGDAVEDTEFLDPTENLTGDDPDEAMQTGYDPPEREPYNLRHVPTAFDEVHGRSLDERLAEEIPDVDEDDEDDEADEDPIDLDPDAPHSPRAGRLVAPDEGAHGDREKDEVAADVGPAGYAATAEEAAMHVISEDELLAEDDSS